jgi:hypothetical protein
MKKLDLKKEWKHLYAPSAKEVQVVDVPAFPFVMIDLRVEPDETPESSQAFQQAVGALYGMSYTLKFMSKLNQEEPIDYAVMALEGLWWTESGEFDFAKKEAWQSTLMMMQPGHITADMFQTALRQIDEKQRKKGEDNPALARLRFEPFHEGLCIQIMHVGPYADEPRTIERMQAFAQENGYVYRGKHHEIYLGDPRRASPEKLRTVLRQPVEKAG